MMPLLWGNNWESLMPSLLQTPRLPTLLLCMSMVEGAGGLDLTKVKPPPKQPWLTPQSQGISNSQRLPLLLNNLQWLDILLHQSLVDYVFPEFADSGNNGLTLVAGATKTTRTPLMAFSLTLHQTRLPILQLLLESPRLSEALLLLLLPSNSSQLWPLTKPIEDDSKHDEVFEDASSDTDLVAGFKREAAAAILPELGASPLPSATAPPKSIEIGPGGATPKQLPGGGAQKPGDEADKAFKKAAEALSGPLS